MRVLITDRLGAHSIWSLMDAIAAALVADGHEVTFCRSDDGRGVGRPAVPAGVEAVDVEIPTKRHVWDLYAQYRAFGARFRQLVRDFRPEIVHTNFCVPGVGARVVARGEDVPVVVSTQHELYASMYPHYRLGVRLTERCADAVVYVSRAVARSFGRPAAAPFDRSDATVPRHTVIYNGVDVGGLEAIAAAVGPVKAGKIVCAGRLMPVKGQRVLVEAMPAVLRAKPDAHLVIIGDGPDKDWLRASIQRLELTDKVRLVGWLPHDSALREMATAAAVAIPSDGTQEGFGLALVEAMALGAPVVASRIPVFEEIAGEETDHMRFFPPGDRAGLAQAVTEMLGPPGTAPDRCPSLERIETLFSVQRMVDSYRALYETLCAGRGIKARPA